MGSVGVVLLLLVVHLSRGILASESSEESENAYLKDARPCPGGYCVKSYLCANGEINTHGDTILQPRFDDDDENKFSVEIDPDDDPCEEFLMRCCSLATNRRLLPNDDSIEMPPPSCGKNFPGGYIFRVKNSAVAQFAEFPWMAALLQRKVLLDKETFDYFCGGSLIHPKVILTAAHCMRDKENLKDVAVRLGEWDTVTENEPLAYQQYGVAKVIVHENYIDKIYHNDLALLIMEVEADLNKHVNPICLPSANDNFDDMRCFASGWGKENFNPDGKYSAVLKKVELPVVPRNKCKQMFKSTTLGPFFRLHSSFLCAGGEEGVDVCTGDGGSPLMCKIGDNFVQAGIVSWGIGCGEDQVPGAYVKVSNFEAWIQSKLTLEGINI